MRDNIINLNYGGALGCESFVATTHRNCPYCGNAYDVITDDWVLIELKK